ncbi:hypothetical protein KY337_04785, partial [Candidatus Woesearchaeota archaeon]|nr:hypothetical protein [Candidatus Woesearchaeota archaeon]
MFRKKRNITAIGSMCSFDVEKDDKATVDDGNIKKGAGDMIKALARGEDPATISCVIRRYHDFEFNGDKVDLLKHMTPVYDGVPACLMAFLANAHTSMERDAIVGPYEFMKDCRNLLEDVLGPSFRIQERVVPVNEGNPHEL